MSIAGIRSNRGDGYQTAVAFDWALTVISDPQCLWLEIDSATYSVDDVVIGKADGTLIACQCKKNHIDFRAWSISDLAAELTKAASFLLDNQNSEVRFYSRNNFGDIAKLREHSLIQNSESRYKASLGRKHQITDAALTGQLATSAPSLSSYELLRRTKFVTSDELERMIDLIRERLRSMASNMDAAFNALWVCLDQLGARMWDGSPSATRYRLTKEDLKTVLYAAGAVLAPPMDLAEVRLSFAGTSAIGRSWRRDIAGQRLYSPATNEILAAIDAGKRAILLTGLPGSGKTCVMLAVQEALEQQAKTCSEIVPLFIQSRDFAHLATAQDRQSQGLPEEWVEKAARLTENARLIVIIDSLDVLSIARDHGVLSYFLAQIDQLLLVPKVTVVTACRDFDRHYDRRIAAREWDCELKCRPLDWDAAIAPLLDRLGIAIASIDETTRGLIKNPRELALFVELAQHGGSFNVVTGQALAQRYLDTIVRGNDALGDAAVQSLESVAADMLSSRSLAVPRQRFCASQEILRLLCSLNVMQETQDGKLTFGHQTLLDVLVISRSMRAGITLSGFIRELPPVPFVRPSIRSFIAQLSLGERREFRKQLRTVLTDGVPFHIRRLVAESFAENAPQDDDWPLIRDLRENHRDVFQIVYGANSIEWHHFWLKYLVPELKNLRDVEGITRHVYRVAQWASSDGVGVLALWTEVLSLDWVDRKGIAEQIGFHLSKIESENISLIVPLLERLLSFPRAEHDFLGITVARCVTAGAADDFMLWRYIAGGISSDDLLDSRIDKKLRCGAHEFGEREGGFIRLRMEQSTALLDLALNSIEGWSNVLASHYGETRVGYRHGFLRETSYHEMHSQNDIRYTDSVHVLFDAVEAAVLCHAKANSDWWQNNRGRLRSSQEGALIYFTILACIASPETNVDLVGHMLCDKNLLEFCMPYELGGLIQASFALLDSSTRSAVMATILTLWADENPDESSRFWVLRKRAELIVAIPCHERSIDAQEVLEMYEKEAGTLIRQPDIHSRGGTVSAPFSYEVFLNSSDVGVLRLLSHYAGYERTFDDFLVGGEREVGWQLREASSRCPARFMGLLYKYWADIPNKFRDDLMDGVATYLAYRYGNLRATDTWRPIEELDASVLAGLILDELEKHPGRWQRQRSAAKALEACSNVIFDAQNAARLAFLAVGFGALHEDDPIKGDNVGLISVGINMAKGDIAEALMILANNLHERDVEFPELLVPALRRFASDEHPAVRSLILRRLPYLQSKAFDLGWDLFYLAMKDARRLWGIAEPCLYYAYRNNFEVVGPLLARLRAEGCDDDLETWGRILALAIMDRQIGFAEFLQELKALDKMQAWKGAATVWTHYKNVQQHREQCLSGISAGLNAGAIHAEAVAEEMTHLFSEKSAMVCVPIGLIRNFFCVFKNDNNKERRFNNFFGFFEWLNATSHRNPEQALSALEIYLAHRSYCEPYLYDYKNNLTQLMTRLFAEAEEREESDCGAMLKRVVIAQDTLLSMGVNGVADWLKAAERP